MHVTVYIETHPFSALTVKQHLPAIRALFYYLVRHGILPHTPAAPLRGPKPVVEDGTTSVLEAADGRKLLDSIAVETLKGLRDRALIGTLLYTFARVGAVTRMRVRDYHHVGRRSWIRLLEKAASTTRRQHITPCGPTSAPKWWRPASRVRALSCSRASPGAGGRSPWRA